MQGDYGHHLVDAKDMSECCAKSDMVGSKIVWLVWRLPFVLFVIGAFWSAGRVWLWVPAMVVAGVACLVNAARCRRLHCHVRGHATRLSAGMGPREVRPFTGRHTMKKNVIVFSQPG